MERTSAPKVSEWTSTPTYATHGAKKWENKPLNEWKSVYFQKQTYKHDVSLFTDTTENNSNAKDI